MHSAATPTFGALTLTNALTASSVTLTDAAIGTATATATTATTVVDSWSATTYRSAKYLVQMTEGSNIQTLEVLLITFALALLKSILVAEYADVINAASSLGTTDADYNGGNVRLKVTAAGASVAVKVHKTLIEA